MTPPEAWTGLPFFSRDWPDIRRKLDETDFLPGPAAVFRALDMVQPDQARVVILGQDPYPTPGHADGLAFSVTPETPLPRSLRNIFKELQDDVHGVPPSGDLSGWARQGVLLLNTSLSVLPGVAGAHAKWGWDRLAREVVAEAQRHRPLAFLLWGANAQKALAGLPRAEDLLIATAHPSPLSARRGFFGSHPFSRINEWLETHDEAPIDWALSGDAPSRG
ncbi:uracil-DNA glycosylase [Paracoccus aurantiacus]|uniref:Uracil-DNA glycosylase n=1 Tax=Paracoccus aurantiacus TaxID=2599412 RepID=A0A5C6S8I7_9RHOB|nr:uracil-DNA glycosylase [Paracoccus aurantiacus]TXB70837.1 uracil-DNA glycosylase [Paracoccus aurantiacus]